MKKLLLVVLFSLVPAVLSAQMLPAENVNSLRISASAYTDTAVRRPTAGIGLELRQAAPNRGVFSSSISFVDDQNRLRAGRGFARWEGIANNGNSSNAVAGTFFYDPQLFENRAGSSYIPSVLVNGFQTQRQTGRLNVQAFAGSAVVEEG